MIEECCICLEPLKGEICEYECGHIFHNECIISWINKNKKLVMPCCICQNTEIKNIFNTNNLNEEYSSSSNLILEKNENKKKNKKKWIKYLCFC